MKERYQAAVQQTLCEMKYDVIVHGTVLRIIRADVLQKDFVYGKKLVTDETDLRFTVLHFTHNPLQKQALLSRDACNARLFSISWKALVSVAPHDRVSAEVIRDLSNSVEETTGTKYHHPTPY